METHLKLTEILLPPAAEWMPDGRCWTSVLVAGGFGYSLGGSSAHEVKTGDAILLGPAPELTFRASQLGGLRLSVFRVMPQRLNGLVTPMEWRQLEKMSTDAIPLVFYYSAKEVVAQKFARFAAIPDRDSLFVRSGLLQLWASCVDRILSTTGEPVSRQTNLQTLFRRLIAKMSDNDLATVSISDMAAQLGCSERHVSRLFREEFGMSFRKKQTELCLQRACQLLLDPSVKVKSAAYDTGYQHVSFFNALFKKRFGVTPKAWRQQHLSAPLGNPPIHDETSKGAGATRAEGNDSDLQASGSTESMSA